MPCAAVPEVVPYETASVPEVVIVPPVSPVPPVTLVTVPVPGEPPEPIMIGSISTAFGICVPAGNVAAVTIPNDTSASNTGAIIFLNMN